MEKGNLLKALVLGGLLTYGGVRNCNDREAREALDSQRSKVTASVRGAFSDAEESCTEVETGSF